VRFAQVEEGHPYEQGEQEGIEPPVLERFAE
jgi:hypothetical protein